MHAPLRQSETRCQGPCSSDRFCAARQVRGSTRGGPPVARGLSAHRRFFFAFGGSGIPLSVTK
jgi:hypothetical protein